MPQAQRLAAIAQLRAFELRVLVSSDLTARGIDVVLQFTCFLHAQKVQILM
jgi:superfamily II DNA/RNA helicase